MKYPIGVQTFEKMMNDGYVYVDKTDLVWQLAQKSVCFLCRPRRFGKSLLVSTLEAYFKGKKELFAGLKINEYENAWKEYPVFHVDFANTNFTNKDALKNVLEGYVQEWESLYGKDPFQVELGKRFQYVLAQANKQAGRRCVVLIDEYDKPLLDVLNDPIEESNRELLKEFYATFKAADADLQFVLLTGVTKFSQISVFSGFNQPDDISMDIDFDAICGITESELHEVFAESIKETAAHNGVTEDEMKSILKKQYDGYHFSSRMNDVYNPFSIINTFSKREIQNYWFATGTPTYLQKLIDKNHVNMAFLLSREYQPQYFIDYRADAQDSLAMLYQSGYLTIKEYNVRRRTFRLDYPNNEVREGLVTLLANDYLKSRTQMNNWVLDIDDMLQECRLDDMRDSFTEFLASIPYVANKDERALTYESHFQYTFYLIFRVLSCYDTLIEKQNSHGRADVIVETDNHVYIFEFKLDGSAEEALQQIDDKGYAEPYLTDRRKIHKIGVNISSETRTVCEWISK